MVTPTQSSEAMPGLFQGLEPYSEGFILLPGNNMLLTDVCPHLFIMYYNIPLLSPTTDPAMSPTPQTGLNITASQVMREMERLKQRKAAGSDHISPHVPKACACRSLAFFSTSSTLASTFRECQCFGKHPA